MAKSSAHGFALGVDIGGTFTDFALLDRVGGEIAVGKLLTDPGDLASGVMLGIAQILAENSVPAADVQVFVHGTTLATNALIERRGARTAFLVTRGFRDTLIMARECRYNIYDLEIDLPSPLVPRSLTFEINERLDAEGAVIVALDEGQVRRTAHQLVEQGVEAVAVCLLHSYRNPLHEQAVARILEQEAPGIAVSVSSDVVPDVGEYERASTTAANAYVRPPIRRYLEQLVTALKQAGTRAAPLMMTSEGGTISCETAMLYPVRLVESGPAGGILATTYFGATLGHDNLISFDMGGTTAKICVIDDGVPTRSSTFEAGRVYRFAKGSGLPLKVPVLEMIEIGAGGGSVAHGDELGLFGVGPQSAGASPGPACYGFGGDMPTVSDADLYLGNLDPAYFLGGRMPLHRDRAEQAIIKHVARPLKLSTARAAWGIHEVVNDNMARAAKIHCAERGKDARDYTLVAFGGAGPVHAYRVAQNLGIRRILYPARAGVMSAFGFLLAPPAFELLRADAAELDCVDLRAVRTHFAEMQAQGKALLKSAGVRASEVVVEREAAVRYRGQSSELFVSLPKGSITRRHLDAIRERFEAKYRAAYHRTNPRVPLEVVSWRAVLRGPQPKVSLHLTHSGRNARRALKGHRPVFFPEHSDFINCAVYDRYALPSGSCLQGPVIIEETESTVVVGTGARIEADELNNLLVTIVEGRGDAVAKKTRRKRGVRK